MKTIKTLNGYPRHLNHAFMVPAEKAITDAITIIEHLGADVRLTNAQIKLTEARALVSEYIDEMIV